MKTPPVLIGLIEHSANLSCGNRYGPAFLQSDWLIQHDTDQLSNFCRKSSILSFHCIGIGNSKNSTKILSCLIFGHLDTGQTIFKHYNHIPNNVFLFNKQFTNRITRSVLQIPSPHFYALPVRKRSSFVFPSTDRVVPVSKSSTISRIWKPTLDLECSLECSFILCPALTNIRPARMPND